MLLSKGQVNRRVGAGEEIDGFAQGSGLMCRQLGVSLQGEKPGIGRLAAFLFV